MGSYETIVEIVVRVTSYLKKFLLHRDSMPKELSTTELLVKMTFFHVKLLFTLGLVVLLLIWSEHLILQNIVVTISSTISIQSTKNEVAMSRVLLPGKEDHFLRRDSCFDKQQSNQVILVTGAVGYIGSHTVLQLLEDGHCVVGLDNMSRGSQKALDVLSAFPNFAFELADLGDSQAIHAVFSKYAAHAVLHLAALAFVRESFEYPKLYAQNNEKNTIALVDSMVAHNISTLVFASTCAVYGKVSQLPITENTPTSPTSPYGQSKLAAEKYIILRSRSAGDATNHTSMIKSSEQAHTGVLNARILRYFNVIGADSRSRLGENPRPELTKYGRIWTACLEVIRGTSKCMKVNDGGRDKRDYVHVQDIARANIAALLDAAESPKRRQRVKAADTYQSHDEEEEEKQVKIWNVATNKAVSTRAFISLAEVVTGNRIPICNNVNEVLEPAVSLRGSAENLELSTGWKAIYSTSLNETLTSAWEYERLSFRVAS
jgi:UDP-arabinose 4-epimerase